MNNSLQQQVNNPESALKQARIIWGAMTIGCIIAAVVISIIHEPAEVGPRVDAISQSTNDLLTYLPILAVIVATPISFFIRSQIFKQGWVEDCVNPQAYLTGTIISLAVMEGAVLLGLVMIFVTDTLYPTILGPGVGLAVFILLFPNGKALNPTPNPYARKPQGL